MKIIFYFFSLRKIAKSIFFCLTILFFLHLATEVLAQDEGKGFSVSPSSKEIILENEQQVEASFEIEVRNNNNYQASFQITAVDLGSLDQSGGVFLKGEKNDFSEKYGLAKWMSLEKNNILLNPGQKQKVKVVIKNEEALSSGGHYGAIVFQMQTGGKTSEARIKSISLDSSLAVLVFLKKKGGEKYGLELERYEFKKNILFCSSQFLAIFKNFGNVHLVPRGKIEIFDPWGRKVKKGILNNESSLILPENSRKIFVKLEKNAPIFLPGYYQVKMEYRYDGSEAVSLVVDKFLLIPPNFIIGVLILSLISISYALKSKKEKK